MASSNGDAASAGSACESGASSAAGGVVDRGSRDIHNPSFAKRVLVGILTNKEVKLNTVDEDLCGAEMKKLAEIVEHLLRKPHDIPRAQVVLTKHLHELGTKRSATEMLVAGDEPDFDDKVKVMKDVPLPWLTSYYASRSTATSPFTREMQQLLCRKGPKQMRLGNLYLTGIPDLFELTGLLRNKERFAKFLDACQERQGSLRTKYPDANIFSLYDKNKDQLLFQKPHGCFQFVHIGGDDVQTGEPQTATHVTCVILQKDYPMEMPVLLNTPIMDNYSVSAAYIVLVGARHYLKNLLSKEELKTVSLPGIKMFANSHVMGAEAAQRRVGVEVSRDAVAAAKRRRSKPIPAGLEDEAN